MILLILKLTLKAEVLYMSWLRLIHDKRISLQNKKNMFISRIFLFSFRECTTIISVNVDFFQIVTNWYNSLQYPKLQPLDRSCICYLQAYFKNFMYIKITIQSTYPFWHSRRFDTVCVFKKTQYFCTFIISQECFKIEWHTNIKVSFN